MSIGDSGLGFCTDYKRIDGYLLRILQVCLEKLQLLLGARQLTERPAATTGSRGTEIPAPTASIIVLLVLIATAEAASALTVLVTILKAAAVAAAQLLRRLG